METVLEQAEVLGGGGESRSHIATLGHAAERLM